ncbi:MAG: hypothetical protein HKO98_07350, partial [Gemmatimonadetes bacterium]|nr:hypothetical protein [Gemmatimonadota bacterium]
GVYAVAVPERGLGLALKVEDGAWRAADAALVAALDRLGWPGTAASPGGAPESDPLAPFRNAEVRNTRGEAVGYVAADFELPEMPC